MIAKHWVEWPMNINPTGIILPVGGICGRQRLITEPAKPARRQYVEDVS